MLVGLSIQEYFQNKYEKELYVERKFAYKLALSISTSFPMNLAILLTYGKVDLYSDPYFILIYVGINNLLIKKESESSGCLFDKNSLSETYYR